MRFKKILLGGLFLFIANFSLAAQESTGQELFLQYCGSCHLNPSSEVVPGMEVISRMEARAIVSAMNDGVMRIQSQPLNETQRVSVAEYVSGSALLAQSAATSVGICSMPLEMNMQSELGDWNGWGSGVTNRRFQESEIIISPENVAGLKLKWAFGIANATQSRSQPAIVDGILFMASQTGLVSALDAKSGCTYWRYQAGAGVRTAISVNIIEGSDGPRPAIFFTDAQTVVYSVDALTGQEIWSTKVDEHPAAAGTGALTYHRGMLYVPVAGVSEESAASKGSYECCTFRGSLSALNANNGEIVWKTYMVDEAKHRGYSDVGVPLWGPAGVAIWSAPTIDEQRGSIYIATGNAYADPAPATSDSIVALSIHTGEIQWINQMLSDVWIMGCDANSASNKPDGNPNCPGDVGPDYDFSASPILTSLESGRDVLIATQKSGMGFAINPEDGKLIWQYRWGEGSPAGGVWGAAVDKTYAYFAVADMFSPVPGGLKAVQLATGKEVWTAPPQDPLCGGGQGCNAAQSAALTTVPGLVFSGANDGGVRAYSAETGEVLWVYNTAQSYETVNGVEAKGGSIDGPGPIVVDGMLYVTAGNGGFFGTAGNVLLAFEIDK